jgi:hypothetical protein
LKNKYVWNTDKKIYTSIKCSGTIVNSETEKKIKKIDMRCNSCSSIVKSGEARKMNANSLTKDKISNQTPNKCTPLKYLDKEQLRIIIVNDKNLKIDVKNHLKIIIRELLNKS